MGENREKKGAELINPYAEGENKTEQVRRMFDSIAPAYDFMNTAMSFGLHKSWRTKALHRAQNVKPNPDSILDIATGTGDVAFELACIFPIARIIGVDLSEGMLDIAREKLKKCDETVQKRLTFEQGNSLNLAYADNTFDLITVAYGVRNFENLLQGCCEMCRVLRPGGALCVIELSEPAGKFLKMGYRLYARHLIPTIGRLISGDSRAYTYLPESIAAAPQREKLCAVLQDAGFSNAEFKSLTFGAVTYYIAKK